jgi:hypothetical protein
LRLLSRSNGVLVHFQNCHHLFIFISSSPGLRDSWLIDWMNMLHNLHEQFALYLIGLEAHATPSSCLVLFRAICYPDFAASSHGLHEGRSAGADDPSKEMNTGHLSATNPMKRHK